MSTEYTFDGLDEWEKNLAQIIDRQYPEEFKQMVIDIAEQALGKAKEGRRLQKRRSYAGGVSAGNGSEASRLPAGLVG